MRSNTSEDGKDRPGSGGSKKAPTAQTQKKHLNNTLKVPSVGGIKLPSETNNEIDVWYFICYFSKCSAIKYVKSIVQ